MSRLTPDEERRYQELQESRRASRVRKILNAQPRPQEVYSRGSQLAGVIAAFVLLGIGWLVYVFNS